MVPRIGSLLALATLVIQVVAALQAPAAGAEPLRLDLRDPAWELTGADAVIEELDGRTALRLGTGSAVRRDVEFLDGTIEFDLRVTGYRSFSFLSFRMESDDEHEEIYFRAHKSRLPDAIQYTPVYRGSSQWQLYHDDRATAPAPFPPDEWIPIRVVVQGSRAAVFVGATEEPQLVVPRLAREPKPGYLALSSFLPLGTPKDVYITSFAEVVVRPGVVDYEFPEPEPEPAAPAGWIKSWEVSSAFVPAEGLITELPEEILRGDGWRTVPAGAQGLIELERHVVRPEGARRAAVLARLAIAAPEATTRRLDVGFSDEVSVFLNGRLLVADDESYSFNLPRRQGLLTGEQLSVFLPLEAGDNELILAIADRFGGWGLSGKLHPPAVPAAGSTSPAAGVAPR